ncbi:MAG: 3-keto-5-aminohexanoate cleavage protein [Spirochaetales bacterium]|nr:3-keto-5-aminohexanoate cleavage protein [Spirochaetales bacterium]
MNTMVLTCAVTGAETTREQNPNLPVTPREIADAAAEARDAGAAILHLHVRDEEGKATQDLKVFKETMSLIRKKTDIVIEVTTGGAVGMTPEERLQPVYLEPEMASLDCGTVNFGEDYLVNTLPEIRIFAREMKARGVRPTMECFDLSHVYTALEMIKEGLVEPPFHFGFVLGVPGGVPWSMDNLLLFSRLAPPEAYWTAIGIGGKAAKASIFGALAAGGFIRQGFEDNVYYEKGRLAAGNAELIERAAAISKRAGFTLAEPGDVRRMLKLKEI